MGEIYGSVKVTFSDERTYKGGWKNDQPYGQGTLSTPLYSISGFFNTLSSVSGPHCTKTWKLNSTTFTYRGCLVNSKL